MKLDFYINYRRKCRQAFEFYEKNLGGRIHYIQRFSDAPGMPLPAGGDPGDVLHARIELGGAVIMGADIPNAEPMRSAYLTLQYDSVDACEKAYHVLAEGGEIFMEMRETNFATRFAMLRDAFGASWMLLCQDATHKP